MTINKVDMYRRIVSYVKTRTSVCVCVFIWLIPYDLNAIILPRKDDDASRHELLNEESFFFHSY
jgi:hypothetical protein